MSYNVKYFLEQCLHSVHRALHEMDAEIIVVDNHSADGSLEYLQPLFPGVRFMASSKNRGFAQANNRAIPLCKGEYILFLNPDTLLPEEALKKCMDYLHEHPKAGALGIRMIDGRGRFLKESKRSFPSPLVSLYKLTGLSALFPKSSLFNKYALGNLDEHSNHVVDVLAGAFMMIRKNVLEQLNGFDEDYFLYGEDIDLSFRMQKAGYENHYFSGTTVLHFKGESSGNRELSRVRYFYKAMEVFVQKHYHKTSGRIFILFLKLAILLRGILSAAAKLIKPVLLPFADCILVWMSLQFFRMLWVQSIRSGKNFGVAFVPYAMLLFAVWFVLSAAFTGMYEKKYRTSQTLVSIGFAVLSMLALYSVLPERIRFSRGVIGLGGAIGGILILLFRKYLLQKTNGWIEEETNRKTIVIGSAKDYASVQTILLKAMIDDQLIGYVSLQPDPDALTVWEELPALLQNIKINRIIFCTGELTMRSVIIQVQQLSEQKIQFLFYGDGTQSIVGSHRLSPDADIVSSFVHYRITDTYQQRMKRLADLFVSLVLLPSVPFHRHSKQFAANVYKVLKGSNTWVGYATADETLPLIKTGILIPAGTAKMFSETVLAKSDRLYAKNYDWWQDIAIVFSNYRHLGNSGISIKNGEADA